MGTRVYLARLAGLSVFDPNGDRVGRVRDAVVRLRTTNRPPQIVGLVAEMALRRRIFLPIGRVTSMDADGTKAGFALELTAQISGNANIPVIASGGAGTMDHFLDVFTTGKADAGLAASIFHFKEIGIPDLKGYLRQKGIDMRI